MRDLLSPCQLCPRACPLDRQSGQRGPCGVADNPVISRHGPSYAEERFLSGSAGSGMIWLTGCPMGCVFCQNFDFNAQMKGYEVDTARLTDIHLELQAWGCHNVNWVTPTHQVPFLVEALQDARRRGFRLPIVYNCGGYESVEVLRRLEGIVDIYLPDFKYWDADRALRHTRVHDYPEVCRIAVTEMFRQVGHLQVGLDGVACRGLAVRHLLMPDGTAEAVAVAEWLRETFGPETMFNPMPQYMPTWRAVSDPDLNVHPTVGEWRQARRQLETLGMQRLYTLDLPDDANPRAPIIAPETVARFLSEPATRKP